MTVSVDAIEKGIKSFLNNEILKNEKTPLTIPEQGAILAFINLGHIDMKAITEDMQKHPVLKFVRLLDSEGNVNIDGIKEVAKGIIDLKPEKKIVLKGYNMDLKITSITIFAGFAVNEALIDVLYNHIVRADGKEVIINGTNT